MSRKKLSPETYAEAKERRVREPMTYARREEIFAKEVIHYTEMAELLGVDEKTASSKILEMKRQAGDRLQMKGRIHIQDYLNWLHLERDVCRDRYVRPEDLEAATKLEERAAAMSKASVFTRPMGEIRQIYRKEH